MKMSKCDPYGMSSLCSRFWSCKSTGKMSKKERKSQIALAKQQLQPIITWIHAFTCRPENCERDHHKKLNDPASTIWSSRPSRPSKKPHAEKDSCTSKKWMRRRPSCLTSLNNEGKSAAQLSRNWIDQSPELGDSEVISHFQGQNKIDGMTSNKNLCGEPSLKTHSRHCRCCKNGKPAEA